MTQEEFEELKGKIFRDIETIKSNRRHQPLPRRSATVTTESQRVGLLPTTTPPVFALVKNKCETDCLPSLEKARQLRKNMRHILRQNILKYLVPIWDCIKSSLFK